MVSPQIRQQSPDQRPSADGLPAHVRADACRVHGQWLPSLRPRAWALRLAVSSQDEPPLQAGHRPGHPGKACPRFPFLVLRRREVGRLAAAPRHGPVQPEQQHGCGVPDDGHDGRYARWVCVDSGRACGTEAAVRGVGWKGRTPFLRRHCRFLFAIRSRERPDRGVAAVSPQPREASWTLRTSATSWPKWGSGFTQRKPRNSS